MTILNKILLISGSALLAAFLIIVVLTGMYVADNNNKLVGSLMERFQEDTQKNTDRLEQNSRQVVRDLEAAGETMNGIVLDLYTTSFATLVEAMANQIFPMVESFDFDSPGKVIDKVMQANGAIRGVRLITNENPGQGDIYQFGDFGDAADRQLFTKTMRGDFAFLTIDMQVSLTGLRELAKVGDAFATINENNATLTRELQENSNLSLQQAREFAETLGNQAKTGLLRKIVLGMAVSLALVGLLVAYFIRRSITLPIGRAVAVIQELEKGHVNQRLNLARRDEIGILGRSMDSLSDSLSHEIVDSLEKLAHGDLTFEVNPRDGQDMVRGSLQKTCDDLNRIMAEILAGADHMADCSSQVTSASQSLSQGATEQASSLEEMTSSMTEMGSQTKLNAENANHANQLTAKVRKSAEQGNRQMKAMVFAMEEINNAGDSISKIIKVIDEIAFQTNLLALNAAVEAARAGRHGRGFAVVAEEVRNLAARSAKAARETAELIEGSVAKTEKGTEIASQTAEALDDIVQGVMRVSELVSEIATASNEQAQGISQVNEGLGQIDQVTQQNTANAEETAAAAEELASQSQQLRAMLARFMLKDSGPASGRAERRDSTRRPQPRLAGPRRAARPVAAVYDGGAEGEEEFDGARTIALDDREFGRY